MNKIRNQVKVYLYWIFPHYYDLDTTEIEEIDCWFNKWFEWLRILIQWAYNILFDILQREPVFIIAVYKDSAKKIQEYEKSKSK